MFEKPKPIFGIIIVVILVALGLLISYSYFTSNLTGVETATTINAENGTLNVSFSGSNKISVDDIKLEENTFDVKTFTIMGNSTGNLKYTLKLRVDENTFNDGEISYTLSSTNSTKNGEIIPSITNNVSIKNGKSNEQIGLINGIFIDAVNDIHTYVMSFNYHGTDSTNKKINATIIVLEG